MGRLIYVMGPSGVGKDTLLEAVRPVLSPAGVQFAHRYITRPASTEGERHIPLTPDEFAWRAEHGFFALHWGSHGLRYGVGIEIDWWLAHGASVVLNGSRAHLATALQRYPKLCCIVIEADPSLRRERLARRGREDPKHVAERLDHTPVYSVPPSVPLERVDNSGPIARAAHDLIEAIRGMA